MSSCTGRCRYHAPERLVYLKDPSFSYPIFSEVRQRSGSIFSAFFAWALETVNLDWGLGLEQSEILMASGDFYSSLGVDAAIGRTFTAEDDVPGGGPGGMVAVISYDCWQRRFAGDSGVIGRTVQIDRRTFTIVGVTRKGFFGVAPGLAPEISIPLTTVQSAGSLAQVSTSWLHLMGRLRDGVSHEQANAAFSSIWPAVLEATTSRNQPADRRARYLGRTTALEPGEQGFSRLRRSFGEPLRMLFALVGLLFAVACASTANLLLARGVARQREIAVRLAIGASRARIVRQLFTESLVASAIASSVGILFALWTGNVLVSMMTSRSEPIAIELTPNWRIILFALAATITTVIVCSVLPALLTTRLSTAATLRSTGPSTGTLLGRWSPGRFLVVCQVAITMVLLVGAALFVRSLATVLAQDAGFNRENVLVVATDPAVAGYEGERLTTYYAQALERISRVPGVAATSLALLPPVSNEDGNWTQSVAVDRGPIEEESSRYVYFNSVGPGYFATLGTRLIRGRDFRPEDSAQSTSVVIINESLARRFFPDQDPLGRRITIGRSERRRDLEIVGLVRDTKYQTLQEPARRIAYLPVAQQSNGQNLFVVVRSTGPVSSIADRVANELRSVDAGVPLRLESINDRIRESLVRERVMAWIASVLGVAALALACAGLYGLLAYAVSRQVKEIGLRLALGATRGAVLLRVLRDSATIAALGIVIGAAASLALGQYVRSLLFQVSPSDLLSLSIAACVMLVLAAAAGVLPARRAATIDPSVALRD